MGILPLRRTPCCFGVGKKLLGGDQEVDVVKVVALEWVHGLLPPLDGETSLRYRSLTK